ncbi:glycosyltransferase family 2 protein [Bacillota bacterium Lsc_1132]
MEETKIASIMVTYNPDSDVIQNARAINSSCEHLVIVDNGSNPKAVEYLKKLENQENITIIYNKKNMGLGHALNQGIQLIVDSKELKQIDWIATFDQDSKIQTDYFTNMLFAYEKHPKKEEVAILAPNWVEQKIINQEQTQTNSTMPLQEQKTVITSGSLVKREIFEKIGLFEEDYFIDFLDHEFCLRARSKGYKIFIVPNVSMVHNLGNTHQHNLLGSTVMATNHNYIRRYYITRNRIYTYRKFFKTEKEWIKEDFTATVKEFLIIFLFEKDRLKKLKSMIVGTFDALRGKKGPGKF